MVYPSLKLAKKLPIFLASFDVQISSCSEVSVHILELNLATTPRLNTARLRAQAGTPEGLVGVSGRILKCKLVHMKAGSILLNPPNRKTRIHIVRYVLSYLNGYKDTYPKIRKDMIHIQKFSHAKRILPAFICTNPRLYILPETRASPLGVPPGARTSGLS